MSCISRLLMFVVKRSNLTFISLPAYTCDCISVKVWSTMSCCRYVKIFMGVRMTINFTNHSTLPIFRQACFLYTFKGFRLLVPRSRN